MPQQPEMEAFMQAWPEEQRRLFDGFTLLSEDKNATDVSFAWDAQQEAVGSNKEEES